MRVRREEIKKKIFFTGGVLVKTPVNMLLHPVDHA